MKTWYKSFSSQPHNSFFANGIIFFMLFMFILLGSYSGFITLDTSLLNYHAYSMIYLVFIQFFLGFLYVVFPRFLVQAEIKSDIYMKHFFIYFLGSLGFFISTFFMDNLLIFFAGLLLFAQSLSFKLLYGIHTSSKATNKNDTKWVLIFFAIGLLSHLLFIISFFDFEFALVIKQLAINMGFYLFLFGIVFTISQRMIPFFSQMKVPGYKVDKSKNLLPLVFTFLVLKVLLLSLEIRYLNLLADIPLFIILTKELIRWKLPLFKVTAIMWVLYLSLLWIPIAFFISILEGFFDLFTINVIFEKAVVHTLALGYFVTVLIGFGTRVVLGHSNRTPHADKIAIFIFIFVQAVALVRIFASFSINTTLDYVFLLNLSAFMLILGLLIWSSRYLAILIKGK